MNEEELNYLLYNIPNNVDYTHIPSEIDLEDVPIERIDKLKELLNVENKDLVFDVSRLLTSWGVKEGFDTLKKLLMDDELQGMIQHRLRNYDDTYKHVLDSFLSYWSVQADLGYSEKARQDIFEPISKIIKASNVQPFKISGLFYVIADERFSEYIPLLKEHLKTIIKHPEQNYWKIKDAIDLFLKTGPNFLQEVLTENNMKLEDYEGKVK